MDAPYWTKAARKKRTIQVMYYLVAREERSYVSGLRWWVLTQFPNR
jgi:hypothetical protein